MSTSITDGLPLPFADVDETRLIRWPYLWLLTSHGLEFVEYCKSLNTVSAAV